MAKVRLRYGHAPGHVRDTFVSAVYAFMEWDGSELEPTVEYGVNYVPREISISQACGLVWNCTDIVPEHLFDWLTQDADLDIRRPRYAACARAIRDIVREWEVRGIAAGGCAP